MRRLRVTGKTKWIGAIVMLFGLASANASTINLNTISVGGTYEFTEVVAPGRSFTDYVRFRLDDAAAVTSFIKSFDLSFFGFDLIGIDNFTTSLQRLGQGGFETIASFTGTSGSFDDLLTPGQYRIALGGTASGFLGGVYRGTLHVAAVPEADTWIMLLVGLGIVLYQLRRKQRALERQQPVLA